MVTQRDVENALEFFGTPPVEANIPSLESQAFTTTISQKCTARFIDDGVVQVFGSFSGFKLQPKSTACPTPFTNYLLSNGRSQLYGPAPMKGYKAKHIALKAMVQKPFLIKEDVMRICADAYKNDVISALSALPDASAIFHEMSEPLSLKAAINGIPGMKYVDSMNFRSSAGFPHNKSKRSYITKLPADDIWQDPVVLSDEMRQEVAEVWDNMLAGVRNATVFMQHLKDEVLPLRKVKSGKARVFMGGPMAWSICVRQLFLPFIRVMQLHKFVFEGAPGMNTTSIEWTRLCEYLKEFGAANGIAGDFAAFDKVMGALVILEAFRIIIEICAFAGMEICYLLAMQTVAEDTAFAFCNFDGDLMMFFGSNPSGHPLTVIINCIVNSLYMRYCYHQLHPTHDVSTFKKFVRLITYGDDNAMTSLVKWFNHTTIASELAKIGITYTMADKTSESRPFIDISEISFLKRSFVWDNELSAYAARLEEASIWKSMLLWIPSSEDPPQKQAMDIVRAAVSEWFFYGRERYDQEVSFLRTMVHKCGLDDYVEPGIFVPWNYLHFRFNAASTSYLLSEPSSAVALLGQCEWNMKELDSDLVYTGSNEEVVFNGLVIQGLVEKSPVEAKILFPTAVTAQLLDYSQGMLSESVGGWGYLPGRSPKWLFSQDPGWWSELVSYISDYRCNPRRINPPTATFQESLLDLQENPTQFDCSHLSVQSLELEDGSVRMQRQENLMFADAGMGASLTTPMVSYRPDGDVAGDLGSFLSRPVAINSFSWVEDSTTQPQNAFFPWEAYFNTTAIKNKISNYARLRAKLHLKFVVNASPFYYGAIRMCYCPLDGEKRDVTLSQGDQIKFSQMPGAMIYPADVTSVEMELPFLWPHSWLDIDTKSDFHDMGQITYYLYSRLRSATGTVGTNATITCYAWASDVELAGLTTGLALQSDEYDSSGKISGPATAVANVAAKLSDVPVIGPLARATEIGARAVGGIASLFGYSNPPVIDDIHGFMPKAFHSFASVETSIPMDKLTIDPKNEITVDKTVTGAPAHDELVISHICGRRTFLFGALWTEAEVPGSQLLRIPVTPRNYSSNAGTSQAFINETPAAHVAAMFSQWRGGMIYTLKFVKSRYHTGRVQISWDPATVPITNAETTSMTRIVDLQLETEVSFMVPFKAGDPWLKTNNVPNNWTNTAAGTVTTDPSSFNGYLRVTVLNELTGPSALQQMDILLFVETAPDFELSVPNELPRWSFLSVQSEETQDVEQLTPIGDEEKTVGTNAVTVGETVASLRTLLHRSSYYHRQPMGNAYSAANTFNLKNCYNLVNYIPRFPVEYGFTAQGVNYATGIAVPGKYQFQFSPNHPLVWVTNCFAGYRGSIVHHYNYVTNGSVLVDELKVERDPRTHILDVSPRQAINRFSVALSTGSASNAARGVMGTTFNVTREVFGQRGMALTNANTQSALSVVTPQYSKWKFRPAFKDRRDVNIGVSEQESIKVVATVRTGMTTTTQDDGWPMLTIYMAGGVDFDPIYFICVPTLYLFNVPAADDSY